MPPDAAQAEAESCLYLVDSIQGGDVRATLTMIRLIERLRRAIAREYALPLGSLLPLSAFVSRIRATPTSSANGYSQAHSDECSIQCHYSAVLYLSTQGDDFEGGDFVFCDRGGGGDSVAETRLSPRTGLGIYFSSGWENVHFVDTTRSGTRFAMPVFFVTNGASESPPSSSTVKHSGGSAADALWRHVLDAQRPEDVTPLNGPLWHSLFARAAHLR